MQLHPSRTCTGFSLTELLIVAVLTLIAASMLIPAMNMTRQGAVHRSCSSNQHQIVMAMLFYANDNDQRWPVFAVDTHGWLVTATTPSFEPTATAIASCEFISAVTGGDLTQKEFVCPSNPAVGPTTPAGDFTATGRHHSGWAANGADRFAYAYDWSSPPDASSSRVVTADRRTTTHKTVVVAAYADGHVENLLTPGYLNPNAADDDIYTATGDGPMDVPGAGSATRAFVR